MSVWKLAKGLRRMCGISSPWGKWLRVTMKFTLLCADMVRSPAVLIIWLVCPLVAVLAGYHLATPMSYSSFGLIGIMLALLLSPLLLRWHHEFLIICWNSFFIVFFLPGQPSLAITVACISLFISILTYALRKEARFISVPSVTWPLLALAGVTVFTAYATGGIGAQALGSSLYGGRRYLTYRVFCSDG